MEKNFCIKCETDKNISFFYFLKIKNKYKDICLSCEKKEHRNKNRDKANKYAKDYSLLNKDKISDYQKKYRLKNIDISKKYREVNKEKSKKYILENKEHIKSLQKKNRIKNKDKINSTAYKRRIEEPLFKLDLNIRNLIKNSFKKKNHKKAKKTVSILGCTVSEFKYYLESKFEPWMNWENHGRYYKDRQTWQLDHIVPASFAKSEEELVRLNHYTNFQPLESMKNLLKSNKLL